MVSAKIVAKALKETYEVAETEGWIDKLKYALGINHKVLCLGETGVGKTSVLQSLRELNPALIHYEDRTEYRVPERIKISKTLFEFIDLPGQASQQSERLREIALASTREKIGIINITAAGYHEHKGGPASAFPRGKTVSRKFLDLNKRNEIVALQEWASVLGGDGSLRWLITVVNKADLWWSQRVPIMQYYTKGEYDKFLGEARDLRKTVVPYSAVRKKFYDRGELDGTFDDRDHARSRERLVRLILESVGKRQDL